MAMRSCGIDSTVQFFIGNVTESLMKRGRQFMQGAALRFTVQFQVVADEFFEVSFRRQAHALCFAFDCRYLSRSQIIDSKESCGCRHKILLME